MNIKFVFSCFCSILFLAFASFAHAAVGDGPPNANLNSPAAFLAQFPNGGDKLASEVRNLLSADKAALPQLMGLLPAANGAQQDAIANGLAQAAKLYLRVDPACGLNAPASPVCFATQIQQAVANSNDPNFIKAYASMAGDTGTASTGGGGGGGGGQTSGNIASGGSNTGNTTPNTSFTPNTFSNLLTSSFSSAAGFSSPGSSTSSVSPTTTP
jgi:hypothetical protein